PLRRREAPRRRRRVHGGLRACRRREVMARCRGIAWCAWGRGGGVLAGGGGGARGGRRPGGGNAGGGGGGGGNGGGGGRGETGARGRGGGGRIRSGVQGAGCGEAAPRGGAQSAAAWSASATGRGPPSPA